jgi:hypothetical protein
VSERSGTASDVGVWVNVACLCERAAEDVDQVLALDGLHWSTTSEPGKLLKSATLVLALTSARPDVSMLLTVAVRPVTGPAVRAFRASLRFADAGVTIVRRTTVELPMDQDGLLWIEVEAGGMTLTRIPHRVRPRVPLTRTRSLP